jgi:hypothetical protein
MISRRLLLQSLPATVLAAGAGPASAALKQRSYCGAMRYSLGSRDNGRENFRVTVQPDGLRTLRAQCELDDDQLLRDVTLTVDAGWRPVTAFIQLTIAGKFAGATWYRFAPDEIVVEGYNAVAGRISQRVPLARPVDAFGAHPIHGDAWNLARLRLAGGRPIKAPRYTSSSMSNGASGPGLVLLPENYLVYALAGRDTVTTPSGSYAADHFTMTVTSKQKVNHIWASGADCIPVRMTTSDGRKYELVELSGDPR